MTTITDVATFITSEATEQDIKRVYDFCKTRQATLRTIRAAAVSPGDTGSLVSISPKYLIGLKGTVGDLLPGGKAAYFILDEASTDSLRYTNRSRYSIPFDVKNFPIYGVPLSAIKVD